MKLRIGMILGALLALGGLQASDKKKQEISWWDRIKSYLSYNPIVRPIAYSLGGEKTIGRTMANLSFNPLVRFRGNLNIIQKEFYAKDLKNAIVNLERELKSLYRTEWPNLANRRQDLLPFYGMNRYEQLVAFVEVLKKKFIEFNGELSKTLQTENEARRKYESDNNIKSSEDAQEEQSLEDVDFDFEGGPKPGPNKQKNKSSSNKPSSNKPSSNQANKQYSFAKWGQNR